MTLNYVAIDIICIVVLILLNFLLNQSVILDKSKRHIFSITIYTTILVIGCQIGTTLTDNSLPGLRNYSILFNVLGFSLSPLIPILISYIINDKTKLLKILCLIPTFINFILVVLSVKFGFIFSITKQNTYERGRFFYVYVVCFLISLMITLIDIWLPKFKYYFKSRIAQNIIVIFTVVGTLIQSVIPELHTTWTVVTCGLVLYYAFLCEQNDKIDSQTNLFNRKTFEDELSKIRTRGYGCFIIFDVDDFKIINDTYGHLDGDRILTDISKILTKCYSNDGLCFRIGGDEFAVISYINETNKIETTFNKLSKLIEQRKKTNSKLPNVSYGYKILDESCVGKSRDFIFEQADAMLYENKKNKKSDSSLNLN